MLVQRHRVGVSLERLAESIVPQPGSHALHDGAGGAERQLRLGIAARVLKELAEREFRFPMLNGISQRGGDVARLTKISFRRVHLPLVSGDRSREPERLDQI